MSQQMHYDEEPRGYQATYTPTFGENAGSYDQHSAQMPAQKIGWSSNERGASAGQRLALAIVSLGVLVAGMTTLSDGGPDFAELGIRLGALVAVCVTAIVINFIFNFPWRR